LLKLDATAFGLDPSLVEQPEVKYAWKQAIWELQKIVEMKTPRTKLL
jgi:hypothetical protein